MKIVSAEFVTSALETDHYPVEDIPEIAFAGRSNVGKSSLMNALLKRKKLVKTSSTPGKTRMINFFLINRRFFFVDLPGFGFARVSKSIRQQWGPMMAQYFKTRDTLRAVVCLVDARRGIGDLDADLFAYLEKYRRHRILVFTKFDKLKKNEQSCFARSMKNRYGLQADDFLTVSATKGQGVEQLWEHLGIFLADVEKKE